MPITFVDIEKKKSWRIGVFFCVLIVLYFLATLSLVLGFRLLLPGPDGFLNIGLTFSEILVVVLFSTAVAAGHFYVSSREAVSSLISTLGAKPPDPDDAVHRRLRNVMEEINIASGRTPSINVLVVPSLSMNALAVAGWKGEAAIAITEGLLSRLSRSQLEAVIAHEAYHVLSGDCLESTVASSLFGMYASMIEKMKQLGEDETGRGAGVFPAMALFWVLLKLGMLLNLFISREREYRADAASLRMTRNPLAMAEVLYMLAKNWNGTGIISSGIEMLCIVHPLKNRIDESEGWFANLLSTHPPIERRISLLLELARMDIAEFSANQEFGARDKENASPRSYYARNGNNAWQGPFDPEKLAALDWINPRTWIADQDRTSVRRASEDVEISSLLGTKTADVSKPSGQKCPVCGQQLEKISYEKTSVCTCRFCGGALVDNDRLPRIIVRREIQCSERIETLARAVIEDNLRASIVRKMRKRESGTVRSLKCGRCGRPMFRKFYNSAYLVEIDVCNPCGVTWFDRDELEIIQCLIEKKITPRIRLF